MKLPDCPTCGGTKVNLHNEVHRVPVGDDVSTIEELRSVR